MNIKQIEAHPILLWAYKCKECGYESWIFEPEILKYKSGVLECFKCSASMGVRIPEKKFKIVEDE